MQFFDKLGEDGNTSNDHIKLNLLEKATVFTITTYIIAAAKKARRAKTYGDIRKILEKVEKMMESSEEIFEEGKKPFEEQIQQMIKHIEDQSTVLTHLE